METQVTHRFQTFLKKSILNVRNQNNKNCKKLQELRVAFPETSDSVIIAIFFASGFKLNRSFNALVFLEEGDDVDEKNFMLEETLLNNLEKKYIGLIKDSQDDDGERFSTINGACDTAVSVLETHNNSNEPNENSDYMKLNNNKTDKEKSQKHSRPSLPETTTVKSQFVGEENTSLTKRKQNSQGTTKLSDTNQENEPTGPMTFFNVNLGKLIQENVTDRLRELTRTVEVQQFLNKTQPRRTITPNRPDSSSDDSDTADPSAKKKPKSPFH